MKKIFVSALSALCAALLCACDGTNSTPLVSAAPGEILLQETQASAGDRGVRIDGTTVLITEPGEYTVKGTLLGGKLAVNCSGHVTLTLDNASIASTDGPAIDIMDADEVTITLAENSINTLSDGSSYTTALDEQDAALFSRADLVINGPGTLTVHGSYNDGIASRDTLLIESGTIDVNAKTHAIKGRDYLWITGGTITVNAQSDGIKATNDEQAALGYLQIDGGTLFITAEDDAISAITRILITGGETNVISGNNGVKSDGTFEMTGGSLTMDCADKDFVTVSQSISQNAHVVLTD